MSEYEALRAQKDEIEKKMSNNPSCIDCAYYATKKDVDLIVQRERARIRADVDRFIGDYQYSVENDAPKILGYVLELLKDGEADA